MGAITSTTASWNSHSFSEVETHIKNYYSKTGHTHSGYMPFGGFSTVDTTAVGWGTLTGSTYTPLLRLTSPIISSDSGCLYIACRNVATNDTKKLCPNRWIFLSE